MLSDEWLPRYRHLENFTAKWNGNGNAYDRGDYNSSFALRAVELKMVDRRTSTDGRRLDGYTISSPCEPLGSGELKISQVI